MEGNKRTVTRDTSVLREFDESEDPNLLVLYHHLRDRAFDCFSATEYTQQMCKYYDCNIKVAEVVSRTIRDNHYFLVCLRSDQEDQNPFCEMAFSAQRQFTGYSMLVKKRCFVCNKNNAKMCSSCHTACFCSKACLTVGWKSHKKLCKLVKSGSGGAAGGIVLDKEALQIEL